MSITAASMILSSFVCASAEQNVADPVAIVSRGQSIERSVISQHGTLKIERETIATQFESTPFGEGFSITDEDGNQILSIVPDADAKFGSATDGRTKFRCALNRTSDPAAPKTVDKPFCEARKNPSYFREKYLDSANRLAFPNGPYGLLDGGLCWWFSRFERNANMLALFDPKQPAPAPTEARKIMHRLRSTDKMVSIPGFLSLRDFTAAYKDLFIAEMENWQITDGIFSFIWVRGLYGSHEVKPEIMKKTMDKTYLLVENSKRPTFHLLQMAGLVAHSWIVLAMEKKNDGYNLLVADSNFNDVVMWHEYRYDMRQLPFYKAVPYLQGAFNREADEAYSVGARYCGE